MKKSIVKVICASLVTSVLLPLASTATVYATEVQKQTEEQQVSGNDVSGNAVSDNDQTDGASPSLLSLRSMTLPSTVGNSMKLLSSYQTGTASEDGGVAEIVKYNIENQKMYVVSGQQQCVDIVKISSTGATSLDKRIDIAALGTKYGFSAGDITSVDVNTELDIVALAVQHAEYDKAGRMVLLNYDGTYITGFETGVQPDMVCFSKDGKYAMTADEGEPRLGYGEETVDPKGSVTLVSLNKADLTQSTVKVCDFTKFDTETERASLVSDKVLLKKNTAPSVDLEPEYIAVSTDCTKAYVSLQEANAVATLDLSSGEFLRVQGLGFKDYNQEKNKLDLNKNGIIDIKNENVYGVYMPDGLATIRIGAIDYVLTPNEGDAREWNDDYSDIDSKKINGSIKKVECIKNDEFDGLDSDKTYIFGGRSFSIFKADTMELVYDSADDFEQITATLYPGYFNTTHKEVELENRSNKKGPEPEDIKTLAVGNKVYAFIGLERIGGVMQYDITNPTAPVLVDYLNNRDFDKTTTDQISEAGDLGAEGLCTIEAQDSPTGYPMLLVANEVSGTVSVIRLNEGKYVIDSNQTNAGQNTSSNNGGSGNAGTTKTVMAAAPQVNWKQLVQELNDGVLLLNKGVVDGNTVNIISDKNLTVPENIMTQIQNSDKVLALQVGDGIAFTLSGKDSMSGSGTLHLVLQDNTSLPDEALQKVASQGVLSRTFAIEETGIFPMKTDIHMNFGSENKGRMAAIYRYNESSEVMQKMGTFVITENGQAMFALYEGGQFATIIQN